MKQIKKNITKKKLMKYNDIQFDLIEEYKQSQFIKKDVLGDIEFNDGKLSKSQITFLKTFYNVYPNIAKALQISKVKLDTLYQWRKNQDFLKYFSLIEEFYISAIKSIAYQKALSGDSEMLKFILKNKASDEFNKPDVKEIQIKQIVEETNDILKRLKKIENVEIEYKELENNE